MDKHPVTHPVRRRIAALRSHRLVNAVGLLVSSTLLSQGLLVLVTPVLTRLYGPTDFGAMAVLMALASTLLTISSARYEMAIVLPTDENEARAIWALAQGCGLIAVGIIAGMVPFASAGLAARLGLGQVSTWLWWVPVYVLFAGIYRANGYLALRANNYRLIGTAKVSQAAGAAGGQLAMGWAQAGTMGLLFGQVLGQAMGAYALGRRLGLGYAEFGQCWRWTHLSKKMARRHRRFPLFDMPAALVDVLSVQIPNLFLATYFGATVAGWYVLAERIVMLPVSILGQSVGQALLGFSREAHAKAGLFKMAFTAVLGLSALTLIPALILWVAGPDLFSWVFGPQWRQAGVYASWLMLGVSVQFVYAPVSMLLMASKGQPLNLFIHSVLLVGKAAALGWGVRQNDALTAVIGFSGVSAIGYALAIALVLRHIHSHTRVQRAELSVSPHHPPKD